VPSLILDPPSLSLVQEIFHKLLPSETVRAFGSRVCGKPKQFSDLDLCMMNQVPIDENILNDLRTQLSESSLPIKVDVVEWSTLSPTFQSIIAQTSIPFPY
jgi:uncharacterized protein